MKVSGSHRLLAGVVSAGAALALGGCVAQNTYGTGVSAGRQTVQDLASIVALGGPEDEEPIVYQPRPTIVAPPNEAGGLPPPGSGRAVVASNWPNDPDEEARRLRAARGSTAYNDQNLPLNSNDPDFRLPRQYDDSRQPVGGNRPDPSVAARTTPEQKDAAQKMYADARGSLLVDENGQPVRRYLSDPPTEYRQHDPDSPVEITAETKKKKKFKWPWEWFSNN
jgi:hypothetical protein